MFKRERNDFYSYFHRSFVVYVMFCRSLLVLLSFVFGHCFVCSSIYDSDYLPLTSSNLLICSDA